MNIFTFNNPTRLIFGEGAIEKIASEIPEKAHLMIVFGGGSVKSNGVYDKVKDALNGREYQEFWGIESNPTVETIRLAVEQGKKNEVNFVLAVGGGSVIDATKLITAAIVSEKDPWEMVLEGSAERAIPFGAVLTLPATASEMNRGAVISRSETKEKYAFYSNYPLFSALDPTVTFSLPEHQIACGLADTFVHVMEQYLTTPGQSRIMDRFAEGVLQTLVEIAPSVNKKPYDLQVRADFMLAATMGLNGFLSMGVTQDWATHMIGHELTALAGVTHGASLVIIMPAMMRVLSEQKGDKILQYGERIWGITEGTRGARIERTIERTEAFFQSLGLPTRLRAAGVSQEVEDEIVRRFADRQVAFGEAKNVDAELTKQILATCRE